MFSPYQALSFRLPHSQLLQQFFIQLEPFSGKSENTMSTTDIRPMENSTGQPQ